MIGQRVTTVSQANAAGMVTTLSKQSRGPAHIILKFHWPAHDMDSEGYKTAALAHHSSMDHLMAMPIEQVQRDYPWAFEAVKPGQPPDGFEL